MTSLLSLEHSFDSAKDIAGSRPALTARTCHSL
jgi:hypothetical protein